jgi:hypothetical protein
MNIIYVRLLRVRNLISIPYKTAGKISFVYFHFQAFKQATEIRNKNRKTSIMSLYKAKIAEAWD